MTRLHLRLFGGFQARPGSRPPLVFARKKAAALLAYLAVRPGRSHPRDKLTALLWGDAPEDQARHSFRQTLYSLQHVLPANPPLLRLGREDVTLDATLVESDVASFERLVSAGTPRAMEQASALYEGDLLDGFRLAEPAFEEWLRAERDRLRELARQTLGTLLAHHEGSRQLDHAVQTAMRLLVLDPLQESVHRSLIGLHARQGRRGAALRQYRLCANLLERELGVEPEPETTRLYRDILARSRPAAMASRARGRQAPREAPAAHDMPADIPLVGREAELTSLRQMFDRGARRSGQVVAVTGEAGIGKSRLVAALGADAARVGARVLVGRSYDLERLVTLRPWADAFRAGGVIDDRECLAALDPTWRAELSRLFPELREPAVVVTHTADAQWRLWEAVARLIEHMAGREPLVVVLEDLQWADESSVGLVSFVAHRFAAWPVLLVLTARADELVDAPVLARLLSDLEREPQFLHLPLRSLSEPETAELVRLLAGPRTARREEAEDRIRHVWAASRGNPFMIVESMRALGEGLIPAHGTELPVPERVARLVASRLARLEPHAADLVAAAAVIGSRFPVHLVARVAQLHEGAAAKIVEDLLRRRILDEFAGELDFAHDWIRAVAYQALSLSRRRYLHRTVARALSEPSPGTRLTHPGRLGVHHGEAEEWPEAAARFQQAGHEARVRGAVREAVGWFEQALAALARLPQTEAVRGAVVDAKMELAQTVLVLGELRRVGQLYEEAEPVARALGDRGRHSQALTGLASHAWYDARFAEGIARATEALEIAEALDDRERVVWAAFTLAQNRAYSGQLREAIRLVRPLIDGRDGPVSQRMATAWGSLELICLGWLALWLAGVGEFDEAVARADRCIELADASGIPQARAYAYFYRAQVNYLRGDLAPAARLLQSALAISTAEGLVMWTALCGVRHGQIVSELGRASPDTLDDMVRSMALQERISHKGNRAASRTWWAAALLANGRVADAQCEAQRALDLARTDGTRAEEAYAVLLVGRTAAAGDVPDLETAAECFARALSIATALELRPLAARGHLALGSVHRRAGRVADAHAHLATAVTRFREMAMRTYVETAEKELAALPHGATHQQPAAPA